MASGNLPTPLRSPTVSALRLIPVGRPRGGEVFEGARLFGGGDVAARSQAIEVTTDATAVAVERRPASGTAGLRIVAPKGAEASVERLLQAVAAAGAPAGSADEPIAIQFSNAGPPPPGLTMRPARMDAANGVTPPGGSRRSPCRLRALRVTRDRSMSGRPSRGQPMARHSCGLPRLVANFFSKSPRRQTAFWPRPLCERVTECAD